MPTTNDPYQCYLRAWQIYLRRGSELHYGHRYALEAATFFRRLADWLRSEIDPGIGVLRWPMNWPEVDLMFGGRDNFTRAVESVESESAVKRSAAQEPPGA